VLGRLAAPADDDAAGLVAEHERLLHDEVADPAVLVVMHVGAAGADGRDLDEHLVRTRRRDRAFLQDEVLDATEDRGAHDG
jgi:hypothetical protein